MSDERKELLEWLYRFYYHWLSSCDEKIEGDNGERIYEQIRQLIQKPERKIEIDETYVDGKA